MSKPLSQPFIVAPSLLSGDFANLQSEVEALKEAGASWIHVDVMDGHFVPNLTVGPPVVRSLRSIPGIYLDCHLMMEKPQSLVEDFIQAGADHITLHVESQGVDSDLLKSLKKKGVGVGLSLKPQTPLTELQPFLPLLDLVLVMTVEPGFGGQSFMEKPAAKVEVLARWASQTPHRYLIQVDGGINEKTKTQVSQADVLVAGSFVFNHPRGYKVALDLLREK